MHENLQLREYLAQLSQARVTVFGDFCLDVYWVVDEGSEELSVETGLPLRRVREQRQSLGGAGNVAANLMALGVRQVHAVGVAGNDIFGNALLDLLAQTDIGFNHFDRCSDWQTMVYAKPLHLGKEQNRFDFGAFNQISTEVEDRLLQRLESAVRESDVVILNQQVPGGINGRRLIAGINQIIRAHPRVRFLVDSRHCPSEYSGALLKLNAEEAARFLGESFHGPPSQASALNYAARISATTGKTVFLTRGEHGILIAEGQDGTIVKGLKITEAVDTVGAGDTVVAALGAALGCGLDNKTAAELANLAAAVTVRKLHTTGTASPAEILQAADSLEYATEEASV